MNLKAIKLLLIFLRVYNLDHWFSSVFLLPNMNLVSFAAFSAFIFFFLRLLCYRSIKILLIPLVGISQIFLIISSLLFGATEQKQTREPQSQLNATLSMKTTWVRISSRAGKIPGIPPEPPTLTFGITLFKLFAFVMFSPTHGHFCDGYLHIGYLHSIIYNWSLFVDNLLFSNSSMCL